MWKIFLFHLVCTIQNVQVTLPVCFCFCFVFEYSEALCGPTVRAAFCRPGFVFSQTCLRPSWGPECCSWSPVSPRAKNTVNWMCVKEFFFFFFFNVRLCERKAALGHESVSAHRTNWWFWTEPLPWRTESHDHAEGTRSINCTECFSHPPTRSWVLFQWCQQLPRTCTHTRARTHIIETPVGLRGSLQDTFKSWAHRKSN